MNCRVTPVSDNYIYSKEVKEYVDKSNEKCLVEVPCTIGTKVYFIIENPLGRPYIACLVVSYKLDTNGLRVRLASIDKNMSISNNWYDVEEFGKTIFLAEKEAVMKVNRVDDIDLHLYQAVVKCDFNFELKFTIDELPIDHIEDDCTIVTSSFYPVEKTCISNKFGGIKTINTGKEIKLGDNYYVLYSTDRKKCIKFIHDRLDIAESDVCHIHNEIDELRKEFKGDD